MQHASCCQGLPQGPLVGAQLVSGVPFAQPFPLLKRYTCICMCIWLLVDYLLLKCYIHGLMLMPNILLLNYYNEPLHYSTTMNHYTEALQ